MTKRAFFRRRKNGPNNDNIFGLRGLQNLFRRGAAGRIPAEDFARIRAGVPARRDTGHHPGETGRQLAQRLRAQATTETPVEAPKRVRKSRAKVAA